MRRRRITEWSEVEASPMMKFRGKLRALVYEMGGYIKIEFLNDLPNSLIGVLIFHLQIRRGRRLCWGATCQQYDLSMWIRSLSVWRGFLSIYPYRRWLRKPLKYLDEFSNQSPISRHCNHRLQDRVHIILKMATVDSRKQTLCRLQMLLFGIAIW